MKTRYIAHITIEAQTPLKVGSNASDFLQDSPIQKDWNSLPMILGTSIAGVLRKDFDKNSVDDIFGNENGSKVIISNALLVDENGKVYEELLLKKSPFLEHFETVPQREHTAITEKGVAKESSKFDEEILYKGTRLKFSIELIEESEKVFQDILALLGSSSFRIGGGSTKGFGKVKVIEIQTQSFDKESYITYSSSLNHKLSNIYTLKPHNSKEHTIYTLKITPDDFFMFGSGFGDDEADQTPVYEKIVDYERAKLSENMILFPASSLKGALAHRTTYHYNLQEKLFIGNEDAKKRIKELFGEAKNSKDKIEGSKGKIFFSDVFQKNKNKIKTFDHVAIDRFTGGALDGALFQEKTIAQKDEFEIDIVVENGIEENYIIAFESSLRDVCSGMLSLGGATTKGHGIFSGEVYRDGVKL